MKIAFMGGGKMAEAILAGVLESGVCAADDVGVCDISDARRTILSERFAVRVSEHVADVTAGVDVVFVAVKPQILDEVLRIAAPGIPADALIISIAAGKSLAQIEAHFATHKAVRVMPNLAARVRASVNVFCCNDRVTATDRDNIVRLLSSFGDVREIEEALFDAVTAVSGSGPAFVAYLVAALADAGIAQGLSDEQAYSLALQTFLGTAKVLREGEESPEALIQSVSSPNGTAVAGMQVLIQSDVRSVLAETVAAAAARSRELREG